MIQSSTCHRIRTLLVRQQTEGNAMGVLILVHILISFSACAEALRRADFPPGFVFGTASSAYQVRSCYLFDQLMFS